MANLAVFVLLAIIVFATAKPAPDYENGGDDGDDYGADDNGYAKSSSSDNRNGDSIPLYETAGAGWGR